MRFAGGGEMGTPVHVVAALVTTEVDFCPEVHAGVEAAEAEVKVRAMVFPATTVVRGD